MASWTSPISRVRWHSAASCIFSSSCWKPRSSSGAKRSSPARRRASGDGARACSSSCRTPCSTQPSFSASRPTASSSWAARSRFSLWQTRPTAPRIPSMRRGAWPLSRWLRQWAMSISAEMKPRIHYGWIVVGVTFFVLLVASGVRGAPSVLIVPLEHEFGWSRAGISLPISIGLLVYGIVGPFSAALIDRFGMRKLVLLLSGFAPSVLITDSWQLIPLWGLATGLGTGIAAMILAAMVSTRWFVKRRGLVMGLLTGAAAAGNLIFLPLLANVAVHIGWRWAVAIACVFVVLAIPVVALFLRSKPPDAGLRPYGAAADYQ